MVQRTYSRGRGGDELRDGLGVVTRLDGAGEVGVSADVEVLLDDGDESVVLNVQADGSVGDVLI